MGTCTIQRWGIELKKLSPAVSPAEGATGKSGCFEIKLLNLVWVLTVTLQSVT